MISPTEWGVDVAPAEWGLRRADTGLPTGDEPVLTRQLATLAEYDLVLIDCPPNLSALTFDALTAASGALVVTEPTFLALHALDELLNTLDYVRAEHNPSLKLAGVVLNRVEGTAEAQARARGDGAEIWLTGIGLAHSRTGQCCRTP